MPLARGLRAGTPAKPFFLVDAGLWRCHLPQLRVPLASQPCLLRAVEKGPPCHLDMLSTWRGRANRDDGVVQAHLLGLTCLIGTRDHGPCLGSGGRVSATRAMPVNHDCSLSGVDGDVTLRAQPQQFPPDSVHRPRAAGFNARNDRVRQMQLFAGKMWVATILWLARGGSAWKRPSQA
jgi:hypothetical protein